MQHSATDQEISKLTKEASAKAKEKNFDGAIETFEKALNLYQKSELFYGRAYVKAIPYYQKAGRYTELEQYRFGCLIPRIQSDVERVFSDKAKSMQQWFALGVEINVYDKLRLCAKRENVSADEARYKEIIDKLSREYEELKKFSEMEQLKAEFQYTVRLFGPYNKAGDWPEVFVKKFKNLL